MVGDPYVSQTSSRELGQHSSALARAVVNQTYSFSRGGIVVLLPSRVLQFTRPARENINAGRVYLTASGPPSPWPPVSMLRGIPWTRSHPPSLAPEPVSNIVTGGEGDATTRVAVDQRLYFPSQAAVAVTLSHHRHGLLPA